MTQKRISKQEKEKSILLGLVNLFLQYGKPIGSNTLNENGFENISPATIRHYFIHLENQGYLHQQHASGGRVPTDLAYKFYAHTYSNEKKPPRDQEISLQQDLSEETKEIGRYLQNAAESLAKATNCAVVLTSPRFDQDFIVSTKLISIDFHRCLCVIVTNFGFVHTELLHSPIAINNFPLEKIEQYFQHRTIGADKPLLSEEEETIALQFYNEVFLRRAASYTHFTTEDMYKTGFAKLLDYPEFHETDALASSLALFENDSNLRMLLHNCLESGALRFWIGEDLLPYIPAPIVSSFIAIPYTIHDKVVGTIGILGPVRLPYRKIFGLLRTFSRHLSDGLTKSLFKFTISYREPYSPSITYTSSGRAIQDKSYLLLEDQRKGYIL